MSFAGSPPNEYDASTNPRGSETLVPLPLNGDDGDDFDRGASGTGLSARVPPGSGAAKMETGASSPPLSDEALSADDDAEASSPKSTSAATAAATTTSRKSSGPGSVGRRSGSMASKDDEKPKDKNARLARFFNLPPDEVVVDEFLCALYKKILLQGRMYLFENYVCFYSNVFGYQKHKVIPLKNVTIVRRAKTVKVVPNAIEIVWNGKCEFFTSFLTPDSAYKQISSAWNQVCPYGRIFAGVDVHKRAEEEEANHRQPTFSSAPPAEIAAMLNLARSSSLGAGDGSDGTPREGGGDDDARSDRRRSLGSSKLGGSKKASSSISSSRSRRNSERASSRKSSVDGAAANPLLDAVAAASPSSARSRKSSGRRSASGSDGAHSGPNSSNASGDGGGGGGGGAGERLKTETAEEIEQPEEFARDRRRRRRRSRRVARGSPVG